MTMVGFMTPLPDDKAVKDAKLKPVDNVTAQFMEQLWDLQHNCPLGIKDELLKKASVIEERMVLAIEIARSELNRPLTKAEKQEVFRAMASEVGTTGHWYQCPNGHQVSYFE